LSDFNNQKNSKVHKIFQKIKYQLIKRHFFAITGPLRVLPDFIIIGAMKSGTTSLYNNICEHPCIESAAYDEIGYFDVNYHLGLNWYRSLFPTKFKKNEIIKKFGKFQTGEDTPFYFWNLNSVKRIENDLPNSKLIVILRNPIDRAYSEYQDGIRNGTENREFEEIIKEEIKNIKNEPLSVELCSKTNAILARGIYFKQLELWKKKMEKMLVIQSEKFSENTSDVMNDVFNFLQVSEHKIKKYQRYKSFKYQKMNKDTRIILSDFFQPYNEQLYKMLGHRFDWDD